MCVKIVNDQQIVTDKVGFLDIYNVDKKTKILCGQLSDRCTTC